jgi:HdeA/HdeB family
MKKLALTLAFASSLYAGAAQAQVMIDMQRITCADFLAMSPGDATLTAAWLSGWFNQKMGYTTVDIKAYERNVENVTKWCGSNPKETLMSGLQRATSPK